MTVYELAQQIPNDNPGKELILLTRLLLDAVALKAELDALAADMPEVVEK